VFCKVALEGQDSDSGHGSILKQPLQLFTRQSSLAEYAGQCAFSQLPVVGDDNDAFPLVSPLLKLDVATPL
jgi:hypothetical protein